MRVQQMSEQRKRFEEGEQEVDRQGEVWDAASCPLCTQLQDGPPHRRGKGQCFQKQTSEVMVLARENVLCFPFNY